MGFPAYEEYKDSDNLWLGDVPSHWGLRPVSSCFRERREKVSDLEYPPLSVTKNGIVPQLEHAAKTDDNDNRKCVIAGDFVINSRSDRKGSSGMATEDGSVSLINTVLTPNDDLDIHYVHHLLRSVSFQEEFYRFGRGIVADLWSTNYSAMKGICLAVPPLPEQRTIASFLDAETTKIDGLVSEQRRLIELLQEKRQAVISHAVTKGLNPDVRMKPSGIPWLGDVPEGWEVVAVKYGITKISQGFSPQCHSEPASEDEWGVVKVGCCNEFDLNALEQKVLPPEIEPVPEYEIQNGDILMSRGNTLDLVGSAALVQDVRPRLLLCDLVYRFRAQEDEFNPAFLVHSLRSLNVRSQIECNAVGSSSTMKKVSQELVRNLLVCRPPVEEQNDIANHLAERVKLFSQLQSQAERAIELLQERRTALISAAVTGKIDVRGYMSEESVA